MKIFNPPARQGGEKLSGSPEDMAQKLVTKLHDTQLI